MQASDPKIPNLNDLSSQNLEETLKCLNQRIQFEPLRPSDNIKTLFDGSIVRTTKIELNNLDEEWEICSSVISNAHRASDLESQTYPQVYYKNNQILARIDIMMQPVDHLLDNTVYVSEIFRKIKN